MTKTDTPEAQDGASVHSRIHALVGAYPDLTETELAELMHWYRREASSYDVAMLSARDDIQSGYNRFYNDHIARISLLSLWVVAACTVLLTGVAYLIATRLV